MRKKVLISVIAFALMFGATLAASAYSNYLGESEIVHFQVAFPAGKVFKPKAVEVPRGPKLILKPVEVDLAKRGVLKKLLNPQVEALSTHWIYNVGDRPRRIRLDLVNVTIPVEWDVHAGIPWDPKTKTFLEPIKPGESVPYLGIDWIFFIPEEVGGRHVWYSGGLAVYDADTGELLTFIPIKIINSAARANSVPGCCEA